MLARDHDDNAVNQDDNAGIMLAHDQDDNAGS
jgi:hypothetical protein